MRLRAAAANGRGLGVVDAVRYLFGLERAPQTRRASAMPTQLRGRRMTTRVLVTGGAGFIGSHVSDLFLSKGWAVDDHRQPVERQARERAGGGDVARHRHPERGGARRSSRRAQFDAIVHLAAQMDVRRSVADPMFDAGVNILGTLNLLEAVRASGRAATTRFVFSSTGGAVYGDFSRAAERGDHAEGARFAVRDRQADRRVLPGVLRAHARSRRGGVRFANVYGPRQDPHGEAGVVAIFCGRMLDGRR